MGYSIFVGDIIRGPIKVLRYAIGVARFCPARYAILRKIDRVGVVRWELWGWDAWSIIVRWWPLIGWRTKGWLGRGIELRFGWCSWDILGEF
jgi:hypothetical protein